MSRSRYPVVVVAAASILLTPSALGGNLVIDGQLVSTVATGTPPLAVSSATVVADLNADLLDGVDASALARTLGNVVRVGISGGDSTSIQAALDSITTASASNPFLVQVGPGIFAERVEMKPFVDIQGSGEGTTTIRHAPLGPGACGAVLGADDAALRFLTVENVGGSVSAIGVCNLGTSPRLEHVTVRAESSGLASYGIYNHTDLPGTSSPDIRHVTIEVDGGTEASIGVVNNLGANTRMHHVTIDVSSGAELIEGIDADESDPVLVDVVVRVESSLATGDVYGLQLLGLATAELRRLHVSVAGGENRYGLSANGSVLTVRDLVVAIPASGGGDSHGVHVHGGNVDLEDCSIEVGGGTVTEAFGVYVLDGTGELRNGTVRVSPGTGQNIALAVADTQTFVADFDVQHSRLEGEEAAITGDLPSIDLRVGASQLAGGTAGLATYTCASSYDGGFSALGTDCSPVP